MKILLIGIHWFFAIILTLWTYSALTVLIDSPDPIISWLSFDGLVSLFYSGIPLLAVVLASYIRASIVGANGFLSGTATLVYFLCYFTFGLMSLTHLGIFMIRNFTFILHVFSLILLCHLCWKGRRAQ